MWKQNVSTVAMQIYAFHIIYYRFTVIVTSITTFAEVGASAVKSRTRSFMLLSPFGITVLMTVSLTSTDRRIITFPLIYRQNKWVKRPEHDPSWLSIVISWQIWLTAIYITNWLFTKSIETIANNAFQTIVEYFNINWQKIF